MSRNPQALALHGRGIVLRAVPDRLGEIEDLRGGQAFSSGSWRLRDRGADPSPRLELLGRQGVLPGLDLPPGHFGPPDAVGRLLGHGHPTDCGNQPPNP